MGDLSPHFSRHEFQSKPTGALPPDRVLYRLVAHLEVLRCLAGHKPLVIISGYRTPAHNARVGGARRSRHLEGDAVDLRRGSVTINQAERAGFTGIGTLRGRPTHVDLRPSKARWTYD